MDEASIIKMVARKDVGVRKAMERYFSGRFSNLRDACRWKKVELKMHRSERGAIYDAFFSLRGICFLFKNIKIKNENIKKI